jgi:hypothetical protein
MNRNVCSGRRPRLWLSPGKVCLPAHLRRSRSRPATTAQRRNYAFAKPSANARYLRTADGRSRRTAAIAMEVARHACHWPSGDPRSPGFTFCGGVASRGPYCARHTALACETPQPASEARRGKDRLAARLAAVWHGLGTGEASPAPSGEAAGGGMTRGPPPPPRSPGAPWTHSAARGRHMDSGGRAETCGRSAPRREEAGPGRP